MKHLLLSLIALSSVAATAQDLFVRPTPGLSSTDSYVFVNDVVLYVENDIELEKNSSGVTEGSIYLRNDGQLIQGSETARNSGNGVLSIYQNATDSDQWTYNYWCYPVGNENGPRGYNTWSGLSRVYEIQSTNSITHSLVAGTTANRNGIKNPLEISTRWIYTHPRGFEAENDYVRINGSNSVPPGMGFTMKGVGVSPDGGNDPSNNTGPGYNYDFRGRPNTGTIEVPVEYNSTLGKGEFTLSGNPYPSALDLNRLWYDSENSGKLMKIAFWDEDKTRNNHYYSNNAGGYGTYVPLSSDPNGVILGVSTPATFSIWNAAGDEVSTGEGTGLNIDRRFAPIGQGFMLVPTVSGGGGVIKIKNAHRRYIKEGESGSTFRRPKIENNLSNNSLTKGYGDDNGGVIAELDPRLPQLRINTYFNKSHIRQMVLLFSDETTDGYDNGYDATSPMDASSESYFPVGPDNDRKPYVISTVPFEAKKLIPIAFKLNKPFKISLETVEEVKMHNKKAYIFDSVENTYQEFTNGKSATYNLPAGTYNNRFFVTFKGNKELLAYAKETQGRAQENVDFFQNNNLGILEVTNPEGHDIEQALVFDMTGKLVYEQKNIGTEKRFSFPTSNLSDGVYIVKLKTTDNIDISYKTSVYNKQ